VPAFALAGFTNCHIPAIKAAHSSGKIRVNPKLDESLDSQPSRKEPGVKKGWIWCVLFATLLAGCNTMAGLGQDIQRGGQKLESSADRHK
jgi:predicted small secreted protein